MYRRYIRPFVLLFFLIAFCSVLFACDNQDEEVNPKYLEVKSWFDYLCSPSLGGRYSGSEGINKAQNYICGIIGKSDSLKCISFPTDKCEMTNIVFHVKGESDSLIVIGAHYDAYGYVNHIALPGADDNLSGVAVVLQLIKAIQKNSICPHYSLELCLWDGEEIGRYGSRYYVSNQSSPIKLYINVDTCGNPWYGLAYAYSDYSPYLVGVFKGVQNKLSIKEEKYNPVSYTTDCEPFRNIGIPFIAIGNDTFPPYLHTQSDNISHISFERLETITQVILLYLEKEMYN